MRIHRRALTLAAALVLAAAIVVACNQVTSRSQAGGSCSVSSSDNPHYDCDPTKDLLCINTTLDGAYYCRYACDKTDRGICESGEVCCPGKIHGTSYGKMGGCMTLKECELGRDAGLDGAGAGGAGGDAGPDGGTD